MTSLQAGFVADVKDVLKVLVMFLPLPGFWALFDQQGSRWTLQATRMNGEIVRKSLHMCSVSVCVCVCVCVCALCYAALCVHSIHSKDSHLTRSSTTADDTQMAGHLTRRSLSTAYQTALQVEVETSCH